MEHRSARREREDAFCESEIRKEVRLLQRAGQCSCRITADAFLCSWKRDRL